MIVIELFLWSVVVFMCSVRLGILIADKATHSSVSKLGQSLLDKDFRVVGHIEKLNTYVATEQKWEREK